MLILVAPLWAAVAQVPNAPQVPTLPRDPEVQSYKLTMENVRKIVEVNRNLHALFESDPELVRQIKRDNDGIEVRPSLRESAARFEKYPAVRAVFEKSGSNAYDVSVAMAALGHAWFALEIKEGRMDPRVAPAPETPAAKANLALLEANRAEWIKLRDEFIRVAQNSPFTQ